MRIAICTDQYLPLLSGLVDSVDTLARELRSEGHTVRIYTSDMPNSVPDKDVFRFPAKSFPGSDIMFSLPSPGAMRDIRNFNPDIVHTHLFGAAGFFAWYAARRLGVPLVGTDHTLPADYLHYMHLNFPPFPYLVRKYAAWFYGRCDLVTTPSESLLKELRSHGMRRPMRIISNHIATKVFRPPSDKTALKEKVGIPERAILLFGRIAPEKNLETALSTFEEVARKIDAMLVVVGGGPYKDEFEQSVRARRLEAKVMMLGVLRSEALAETISACDALLITSTSETQSMTTLQAMSCEVPVVAVNAGGLPEYVRDGSNGFLAEPQDVNVLAARLLQILHDPELARRLGRAGRESVLPFSSEHTAALFEQLYADAIERIK